MSNDDNDHGPDCDCEPDFDAIFETADVVHDVAILKLDLFDAMESLLIAATRLAVFGMEIPLEDMKEILENHYTSTKEAKDESDAETSKPGLKTLLKK